MHTIMIDGSMYATPQDLHTALRKMLSLPEYYGMNADALNDCLSERSEKVNLWIYDCGKSNVAEAVSLISRVIVDNGGKVKGVVAGA